MMLPWPCGLHDAQLVLHAEQRAEHVGLERGGKAFRGLVRDRTARAFGAGVVHGDIETTKPRDGLIDHVEGVILLAHVGVDELSLRTEGAQFIDERLAGLLTPASDDDFCSLPGEGDGGGAPDACQSAGNQEQPEYS